MSKEIFTMTREKHPLFRTENGKRVKICADSESAGGLLILYNEKGQMIAKSNNQEEYFDPQGVPIAWDNVTEKWVPVAALTEEV